MATVATKSKKPTIFFEQNRLIPTYLDYENGHNKTQMNPRQKFDDSLAHRWNNN